jgi:hypothetical protein
MNHFLLYATANELDYSIDFENFKRLLNNSSGVNKVLVFIAVSLVKEKSEDDVQFVKEALDLFQASEEYDLQEVLFSSNVGRDFSSYGMMLRKSIETGAKDDYVLFQNRSALGPENPNWYSRMIEQFNKFDNIGLCGATINFRDHPLRSNSTNVPHVQTYVFLSKMELLYEIGDSFPGEHEVDRVKIILNGEIGLSEYFLNRRLFLTCLEWTDAQINRDSRASEYSEEDIKTVTKKKQDFIHRRVHEESTSPGFKSYLSWYYMKLKYFFLKL